MLMSWPPVTEITGYDNESIVEYILSSICLYVMARFRVSKNFISESTIPFLGVQNKTIFPHKKYLHAQK